MSAGYKIYVDANAISGEKLRDAELALIGIPGGIEKALRSTMSRVTSSVKSKSSKQASEIFAIKKSVIDSHSNVSSRIYPDSSSGTIGAIKFSGRKIALPYFSGTTPKTRTEKKKTIYAILNNSYSGMSGQKVPVHPSVASKARQLKSSSPKSFRNAFVTAVRAGNTGTHVGLFERTSEMRPNKTYKIKELSGDAFPQMVRQKDTSELIVKYANETFDKRIEHEVERIIKGYGAK